MRKLFLVLACLVLCQIVKAGIFDEKKDNPDRYPSIGLYTNKLDLDGYKDYPAARIFQRTFTKEIDTYIVDFRLPINEFMTLTFAYYQRSEISYLISIPYLASDIKTNLWGQGYLMGIRMYLKN